MKTVFFDVDTQLDFLYPAGALYVPGAEDLIGALSSLTKFAASNKVQTVSTVDAHSEDDPEFRTWKPHCVAGTTGQQKAASTVIGPCTVLSTTPGSLVTSELIPQIVVEKQNIDCFTNPNLGPLLEQLGADRYVVYGVVSEVCVRYAAFGLLKTGARVEIVSDAIKALNPAVESQMLQEFKSSGGVVTTVKEVVSQR